MMIHATETVLRARLTARWEAYGLPAKEIRRKVEENDLPNGRLIVEGSVAPDYVLQT